MVERESARVRKRERARNEDNPLEDGVIDLHLIH